MSDKFNQSEKVQVVTNPEAAKDAVKNQLPKPKPKKKATRLSNPQYFKLCEWLRNKEESIRDVEWYRVDLAKRASEELGFHVPQSTLVEASESTGVKWKPRGAGKPNAKGKFKSVNAIRNLTVAVMHLYKECGVQPTEGLQALYDSWTKKT